MSAVVRWPLWCVLLFSCFFAACSGTKNQTYEHPFRFKMANGQDVDESAYKGKITFIEFWGTWCPPCVAALPHLQAVYNRYKDNPKVAFLMVSVQEPIAEAQQFMQAKGYTLPLATDAYNMAGQFRAVGGYPTSYILDEKGHIVIIHRGYNPNEDLKWNLSREIDAQLFHLKK